MILTQQLILTTLWIHLWNVGTNMKRLWMTLIKEKFDYKPIERKQEARQQGLPEEEKG